MEILDPAAETAVIGSLKALTPLLLRTLPDVEESFRTGALAQWQQLAELDPQCTPFQMPGWSLVWYRCYAKRFDPLVVALVRGGELVGLATLAVERRTRRVTFAGDAMADYRHVLARPEDRKQTVAEMLRVFRDGNFPNPLSITWTLPESDTVTLAESLCPGLGLRAIPRPLTGWRWWPSEKKKPIRHLNSFQREGPVVAKLLETAAEWEAFRDEYYDHHSLRQLYGHRPVSFNDADKRAFFDGMVRFTPPITHVSSLRVGDRLLAGHYGFQWKGILYLGAPAFDVREDRRSPGLILMSLMMQRSQEFGLRGIDFTAGSGGYKDRLGNEAVTLLGLEIYSHRRQYWVRSVRGRCISALRALTQRMFGPRAWEDRVARRAKRFSAGFARMRELGLAHELWRTLRRALAAVYSRSVDYVLTAAVGDLEGAMKRPLVIGPCRFARDAVCDLLRWENLPAAALNELSRCTGELPDALKRGWTLHTATVGGMLAAWAYSEPGHAGGAGSPPCDARIQGFYVLPSFRSTGLPAAFVASIALCRTPEASGRVTIEIPGNAVPLRELESAGLRRSATIQHRGLLRWRKTTNTPWPNRL